MKKIQLSRAVGTQLLLILTVGLLVSGQANAALSQAQLNALGSGIYYFDPDAGSCDVTDTSSGQAALVGNDNVEKAFNFLVGKGLSAVAAAGAVGNLMQESGVNPTSIQDPSKGDGHGIAQWGGGRYTNLVNYGKNQSPPIDWTDLTLQFNFFWGELPQEFSNTHLSELQQVEPTATATTSALDALKLAPTPAIAAKAFEYTYERAGEPAMDNRVNNATAVYTKYAGSTGASTIIDSNCTTAGGNGVVLGSIVQTAIGLAWPTNQGHDVSGQSTAKQNASATAAYQAAWDGASDMTDCGAFVATVMIKSGADTNYPQSGTGAQAGYVRSSSKYTVFSPTNSAELKPGDILIENSGAIGHTMIYVGPQTGGYLVVDASWHSHTPMLNSPGDLQWMLSQSGIIAARFTGTTN